MGNIDAKSLLDSILKSAKVIQDCTNTVKSETKLKPDEVSSEGTPPASNTDEPVGSVILARFDNNWYPARVLKNYPDRTVKAMFIGWIDNNIVKREDIKKLDPPSQPYFREGDQVMGEYNGDWFPAEVVGIPDQWTYKLVYPEFGPEELEACYTQVRDRATRNQSEYRRQKRPISQEYQGTPSHSRQRMASSESPYAPRGAQRHHSREVLMGNSRSDNKRRYEEQELSRREVSRENPPRLSSNYDQLSDPIGVDLPKAASPSGICSEEATEEDSPVIMKNSNSAQHEHQYTAPPTQAAAPVAVPNTLPNNSATEQELRERLANLESMMVASQQQFVNPAAVFPFMNPAMMPLQTPGAWPQVFDPTMNVFPQNMLFQTPIQAPLTPQSQQLQQHIQPVQQPQQVAQPVQQPQQLVQGVPQIQQTATTVSNPPAQSSNDSPGVVPNSVNADSVDWTCEDGIPMDYNNKPLPSLPKRGLGSRRRGRGGRGRNPRG